MTNQTIIAKPITNITTSLQISRIQSIDLLRGLVMIIMALDHVRDYFHADAFLYNPLDLDKTNAPLFLTRWITHFCAPVFVFLAGTSAFLVGTRKGKSELTSFLLTRGLWLIVLEFTIINFSWFFNPEFRLIALTVIWALAICMIILAGAIHIPFKAILILGLIFFVGHNLLDSVHVSGDGVGAVLWSLIHEQRIFEIGRFIVFVGYPILPWAGIMFLGYCTGALYKKEVEASYRKKMLLQIGVAAIVVFVLLRTINIYGDPSLWSIQRNFIFNALSFINVTKYPPSLLYGLITLGPALIFLALTENISGKVSGFVVSLGRVPMFYYIVHLYLIHLVAVAAAVATGYQLNDMVFVTWVTDSPNLKGYGFNLGIVYIVWIVTVIVLFPVCIWYDRYKIAHKEKWWLSYL